MSDYEQRNAEFLAKVSNKSGIAQPMQIARTMKTRVVGGDPRFQGAQANHSRQLGVATRQTHAAPSQNAVDDAFVPGARRVVTQVDPMEAALLDARDAPYEPPAYVERRVNRMPQAQQRQTEASQGLNPPDFDVKHPAGVSGSEKREFNRNIKVYGKHAAVAIEADETKAGNPTIAIEIAPKNGDNTNWSAKTRFQLTTEEFPIFCAVMLGYLVEAEFKFHGQSRAKMLGVHRRNDAVLVRLGESGKLLNAPIPPGSLFSINALCLEQLRKVAPGISDEGVNIAMKGIVDLAMSAYAVKPVNNQRVS